MSRLPSALGTVLTGRDVEAAKAEILEALAKSSTKNASKALAPSKLWPAAYLDHLEQLYDNMEWSNLVNMLYVAQQDGRKLPPQLQARKLFATLLGSTEPLLSRSYRDAIDFLKSEVTNGDLYVGLALAKLNHFNVVDCASLLSLAELCPSYHARFFRLAQDKLSQSLSSNLCGVFALTDNLRSAEGINTVIEKHPAIKEARMDVELALKEWHSSSVLQRYKLTHEWLLHPLLNLFNERMPVLESEMRNAGDSLLGIPDNVYIKIMEYAGVSTMLNTASASKLASERTYECKAWCYHTATAMGIAVEDLTPDEIVGLGRPFVLQQAHAFKKLATAPHWDDPSVLELISTYSIMMMVPVQPAPCADALALALLSFCSILAETMLIPVIALQWLVSSTNFHFTLARFISSCTENEYTVISLLRHILTCGAPDASKWLSDLKDAGFERILLSKAAFPNQTPLQLLAYMKLQHLGPSQSALSYDDLTKAGQMEADEAKEHALKVLPGLYQFASFSSLETPEISMGPCFASFQVSPEDIEIIKEGNAVLAEDLLQNPYNLKLPADESEAIVIAMKGIGKAVTELGEQIFAEMNAQIQINSLGDVNLVAHIPSLSISVSAQISTRDGIVGQSYDWTQIENNCELLPCGGFMLWKHPLPNTEPNWDLLTADLDALEDLRTSGWQAERRQELLNRKLWFNALYNDTTASVQHHRMLIYSAFYSRAIAGRMYSETLSVFSALELDYQLKPPSDPVLRRRPYDTEEFYNLRHVMAYNVAEQGLQPVRITNLNVCASDHCLTEFIIATNAFIRLLKAILKELSLSRTYDLAEAFLFAYEFAPNAEYLIGVIGKLEAAVQVVADLTASRTDSSKPPRNREIGALYDPAYHLARNYLISHRNNPQKASQGLAKLLNWMMKDDSGIDALPTSTVADALGATTSPLVRSILTETQREESGNDYSKLYRKWMKLMHFSSASLDPLTLALSPDQLIDYLGKTIALVPMRDESVLDGNQVNPTNAFYESGEDSDSEEEESSLNLPLLIAGGVAFAAAITAGAILATRRLSKKS